MAKPDPGTQICAVLPSLPRDGRAIFFGGSFDPPHQGHRDLPNRVSRALEITKAQIIYVPAARSPLKDKQPTAASHRLEMLRTLISGVPNSMIWSEEIDRASRQPSAPSYWTDTWRIVRDAYSEHNPLFLIGADQAVSMHRWRDYDSFWKDAVVMLRDEHEDRDRILRSLTDLGVWSSENLTHWRSRIVMIPMISSSSTMIREALRDQARRENPIAGLDDRVHEYILRHGLYREA